MPPGVDAESFTALLHAEAVGLREWLPVTTAWRVQVGVDGWRSTLRQQS